MRRSLSIILAIAIVLAITCVSVAVASSPAWSNLTSVTVTVQNGSLPPPGGAAHTTTFATKPKLTKATKALNANHIARQTATRNTGACAGGTNVTVKIVRQHGAPVSLTSYLCGGGSFGTMAGNVPGFLKALGITRPGS